MTRPPKPEALRAGLRQFARIAVCFDDIAYGATASRRRWIRPPKRLRGFWASVFQRRSGDMGDCPLPGRRGLPGCCHRLRRIRRHGYFPPAAAFEEAAMAADMRRRQNRPGWAMNKRDALSAIRPRRLLLFALSLSAVPVTLRFARRIDAPRNFWCAHTRHIWVLEHTRRLSAHAAYWARCLA